MHYKLPEWCMWTGHWSLSWSKKQNKTSRQKTKPRVLTEFIYIYKPICLLRYNDFCDSSVPTKTKAIVRQLCGMEGMVAVNCKWLTVARTGLGSPIILFHIFHISWNQVLCQLGARRASTTLRPQRSSKQTTIFPFQDVCYLPSVTPSPQSGMN